MSVRLWSSEAWREPAVGWIDRRLAEAGLERTGAVEQPRVRPWATVLRAPTTDGDGGPPLGELAPAALGQYGRLQRALAPHADELVPLGVPDMRPEVMPARFDEALEAARASAPAGGGDEGALARVGDVRDDELTSLLT